MSVQAENGADGIAVFDTAAGELDPEDFARHLAPGLRDLAARFKSLHPGTFLVYYSKNTHLHHLRSLECGDIDVLGVDWRVDLSDALDALGGDYLVQGNLDPCHLHLPPPKLVEKMDSMWRSLARSDPSRWIAGLGHGVLPGTPEGNVALVVAHARKRFLY